MIAEKRPAVASLSIEEKWNLAVELWDEVSERQQELPTNQAILDVVEQRFADYERDPSTAMTLDTSSIASSACRDGKARSPC